ncbi:MAG TPA: hypothetical protein DEQ43_11870 [Nocardioides bacterium]|uniref:hypothetical protein n=1 Tax=uncultured Nocardioides sp. TaxID=198441 RepID=UPI000EC204C0|nr:hypothetical protein [uncultured Nocardioides sp.]HCB04919.1 hypothetical protein [Nocardioides sp.]HRK47516.1 hypothetical protein [Nocardioides sp.]
MKKALLAVLAVVVATALGLGAWTAFAADDDERTARGTCESRSTELSVERDDGGLEVSFELQSTAPGETWDVLLEQGGTTLLEGQRQTDEDAELDVDAPADADGSDEFTATATPADGGEPCIATVTR